MDVQDIAGRIFTTLPKALKICSNELGWTYAECDQVSEDIKNGIVENVSLKRHLQQLADGLNGMIGLYQYATGEKHEAIPRDEYSMQLLGHSLGQMLKEFPQHITAETPHYFQELDTYVTDIAECSCSKDKVFNEARDAAVLFTAIGPDANMEQLERVDEAVKNFHNGRPNFIAKAQFNKMLKKAVDKVMPEEWRPIIPDEKIDRELGGYKVLRNGHGAVNVAVHGTAIDALRQMAKETAEKEIQSVGGTHATLPPLNPEPINAYLETVFVMEWCNLDLTERVEMSHEQQTKAKALTKDWINYCKDYGITSNQLTQQVDAYLHSEACASCISQLNTKYGLYESWQKAPEIGERGLYAMVRKVENKYFDKDTKKHEDPIH